MNDQKIYDIYKNKPLREAMNKYMDKNKKNLDIPFLTVKNTKDLRYSQDSIGDTYGGTHPLYANRKLSDVADILREEGVTVKII